MSKTAASEKPQASREKDYKPAVLGSSVLQLVDEGRGDETVRSALGGFQQGIEIEKTARANALDHLSRSLIRLSSSQRARLDWLFEKYLNDSTPGKYGSLVPMPANLREQNPDKSWVEWLALEATDDSLEAFIRWHAEAVAAEQQSPAFELAVKYEKERFKRGVDRGISEGWLHPLAAHATQDVDDISVYVGDYFNTVLKGFVGYHKPGSTSIAVAQGDVVANVRDATVHELSHAVLGRMSWRWLNEAITEHIALVMQNRGNFRETGTSAPGREGSYEIERDLFHIICTQGLKPVDPALFTRLYSISGLMFDPSEPNYEEKIAELEIEIEKAESELAIAITEAWGENIVEEINKRMEKDRARIAEKLPNESFDDVEEAVLLRAKDYMYRAMDSLHFGTFEDDDHAKVAI